MVRTYHFPVLLLWFRGLQWQWEIGIPIYFPWDSHGNRNGHSVLQEWRWEWEGMGMDKIMTNSHTAHLFQTLTLWRQSHSVSQTVCSGLQSYFHFSCFNSLWTCFQYSWKSPREETHISVCTVCEFSAVSDSNIKWLWLWQHQFAV